MTEELNLQTSLQIKTGSRTLSPTLCILTHLLHFAAIPKPQTMHFIKSVVSTPKHTFKAPNTTLDLSYITPRLIVAAGPTDTSIKTVFRDNIAHVVAHLDRSHGRGNWHVWNLRGEGPGYALNAVVGPHCSFRPFPDHQVPTLELMEQVALEIYNFLQSSNNNVAFIHCKEGKGRSGTVCCGYLMYEAQKLGVLAGVEEMVAKFTVQRMRRLFGPGVSIDSQLRFLGYWKTYLEVLEGLKRAYSGAPLVLSRVVFDKPHKLLKRLRLAFYKHQKGDLASLLSFPFSETSNNILLDVDLPLKGVSLVKVLVESPGAKCYCWMSPYFETLATRKRPISEGLKGSLTVSWDEWDGFWGTKWKGPVKLFKSAEIHWEARKSEE